MCPSTLDVVARRLRNQRLVASPFRTVADAVSWFGAVQSQDYGGAKWGVGQRCVGVNDATVDRAFDQGTILRTHVLRPTWHFVVPADIRFMLALTAPRIRAAMAYYDRLCGLDRPTLRRSAAVLEKALRGGRSLTRLELAAALGRSDITAAGQRLGQLMMNAELDGLICSGPRRGKQFTYALLEERVAPARNRSREEALAELSRRYLQSHGPATARDFAWWAGLTIHEAATAFELLGHAATREKTGDLAYWFLSSPRRPVVPDPTAHLLPNYDEYLIAFKDRGSAVPAALASRRDPFAHHLVVDGRLSGSWRRTVERAHVVVDVATYRRLTNDERRRVMAAGESLGRFLERDVRLSWG